MSTVLDDGRGASARANGQTEDETSPNPTPLGSRRPPAAVELFGRNTEHTTLVARLRDDPRRLVTLVGPGGVGKTSLALQAAAALADDPSFPDGVAGGQRADRWLRLYPCTPRHRGA